MSAHKQIQKKPVRIPDATIERILARNDRIFAVFVAVGLLSAVLILVIMILRWDF